MEKIATENLFLLEFLVDKVSLDPVCCSDEPDMMGETCVSVQFLDNVPLDICEDDFDPKRDYKNDAGNLKSGKSCLFSLTPDQANEALNQFDVYVTIFKKMQPGCLPEKYQIGNSLISISNLFSELIDSLSLGCGTIPAAKTLKDTFKITSPTGQTLGDISIYIRMSCFGKLIVTQFQMNLEDKSVLFKDKEGHSLYRYKKAGKSGDGRGSAVNGCPEWDRALSGGKNTECPRVTCPPRPMPQPPVPEFDIPCMECAAEAAAARCAQMFPAGVGTNRGVPSAPPPGCYQEIGASMGGNALTIRVHKDSNKIEQVNSSDAVTDTDSCSCSPGNIGQKKRSSRRNSGGGSCAVEPQDYAMRPGVPVPNNNDNSPFAFKMAGCGSPDNNVTVMPPVSTAPDGTKFTEISDPDRDVFILRIGKKSEGADKKSNIELELCTPKGIDMKPRPKKETRDTQYDERDLPAPEKKDKAAKGGKGGKGGKKGKK